MAGLLGGLVVVITRRPYWSVARLRCCKGSWRKSHIVWKGKRHADGEMSKINAVEELPIDLERYLEIKEVGKKRSSNR